MTTLSLSVQSKALLEQLSHLLGELALMEERQSLIHELDEAILRCTVSPQEALELIIRKGLSKTGSQHGQVVELYGERLLVSASSEPDRVGQPLELRESLCGTAVLEKRDQHVPDVRDVPEGHYVRYHEDTQSELVVLIQLPDTGRVLGVLDFERTTPGDFDEPAKAFATLLAGQAAIALQYARTWSSVGRVFEASTSLLSGTVALEQSYQAILGAMLDGLRAQRGQILAVAGDELEIVASSRVQDVGLRPSRDGSVCGRFLLEEGKRHVLVIDDIEASPYKDFYLSLLGDESAPMRSEMVVPLVEDDLLIGALNVESPAPGAFSHMDKSFLSLLGSIWTRALSATLARTREANRERIAAATLATTQLGHFAHAFLHGFGSDVGASAGNVKEVQARLRDLPLPEIRAGVSIVDFLESTLTTLTSAGKQLEDFANRFNPEQARFELRNTNVLQVVRQRVKKAESRFADQNVQFQFVDGLPIELGSDGKPIQSHPVCRLNEQMDEVLDNLLNNAAAAIRQKDDRRGTVRVSVDQPNAMCVRLSVTDDGVGIPEENKPKILVWGFTTHREKGRVHGIGLWFCDLYVQQVGGRLSFQSEFGKGATFEIVLPTLPGLMQEESDES